MSDEDGGEDVEGDSSPGVAVEGVEDERAAAIRRYLGARGPWAPEELSLGARYTLASEQLRLLLRKRRRELGLTQVQVAAALALPRNAVANVEVGCRAVSAVELVAWCQVLGLSRRRVTALLGSTLNLPTLQSRRRRGRSVA